MDKNYRLRYLFLTRAGGAWGNDPELDNSFVCLRVADFETHKMAHSDQNLTKRSYNAEEFERKKLITGDIIIEKSGGGENQPVGRIAVFSLNEPATCSNFMEMLRPNPQLLFTKFGAYLLYSLWASRYVEAHIKKTTGIQNLDSESYFDIKIWLPPLELQQRIANYLDSETHFDNRYLRWFHRFQLVFYRQNQFLIHSNNQ